MKIEIISVEKKQNVFVVDITNFSFRTSVEVDVTINLDARMNKVVNKITCEAMEVFKFKLQSFMEEVKK